MKIMHRIFLILTAFMPVVSSAGSLEQLHTQSCGCICDTAEFEASIPQGKISNTLLITVPYAEREVSRFLSNTTLPNDYQSLGIYGMSEDRVSTEFQILFQSTPPWNTIRIVFDSAFIEKKCPLPLPLIEAMYYFAAFKKNESLPMKNDEMSGKIAAIHPYFFFLYVWHRTDTPPLSSQEKEESIHTLINIFDQTYSLLMQKNAMDLQISHHQNTCHSTTPHAQSTSHQRFLAPLPAAHFMPPQEGPSPTHFLSSKHSNTPHLFGAHNLTQPVGSPALLSAPVHSYPHKEGYAFKYSAHPQPQSSTYGKYFDATKPEFLQQMYTIGCFQIPLCDEKHVRIACIEQFGYITFDDFHHDTFFFLSNCFFCEKQFSIDDFKTQWLSVFALTCAKKLDYFNPQLPTETKEYFLKKLKMYDRQKSIYHISKTLQELKTLNKKYVFQLQKWKNIAASLFFQMLYRKFNNDEILKKKLLKTGNAVILYQHSLKNPSKSLTGPSAYDLFWGVNAENDSGYNVLGNLLCLVREYFRSGQLPPPPYHDM